MKLYKNLLCTVLILCIGLSMIPAAFADEAEAENTRFSQWDITVHEMLAPYEDSGAVIYCGYLNLVTGEEHYYRGDEYTVAASMYKVPLNMVIQEKMASGKIDWDAQYPYRPYYGEGELLEKSIIDSDNNAAMFMWGDVLGGYDVFRIEAAKFSGETEDDFNDMVFINNLYTPRIIINTLRYLYENAEQFPTLIKAMQKAEPERFFKYKEARFNIAHKYGYLDSEYGTVYMNDSAICYTDDPIAIVMFTENIGYPFDPEELLTDYCTAMCNYTQEQVKAREEAARAAAAPVPTEAPKPVEKPVSEPGELSPADAADKTASPVIPCVLIAVFALAMLVLLILRSRKYGIRGFWMLLCLITVIAALLVTVIAKNVGTVYARPSGDPRQEISDFMENICTGNYAAAYTSLRDYSTLGLENEPSTEAGRIACRALRGSYEFTLLGDCEIDKLSARQGIRLRYLDLPSTGADIQARTMEILEQIVQERPHSEVYDANSQYLPQVANEAYLQAVAEIMAAPENYYMTADFVLSAEYSEGSWKIITVPAMLRALNGGAGY